MMSTEGWLDEVMWDDKGLVAAIAQDYKTGQVLMMAWMSPGSLALTQQEQRAVYWSRSRDRLWRKGEESGHVQKLHSLHLDCDADVILLQVEQIGGIACHTGRPHCFFRRLKAGQWCEEVAVAKDPKEIYKYE